jgi:hypothetical protein
MKDSQAPKSNHPGKYFILLPVLVVLFHFLHNANNFNEFIFVRPVLWFYLIHTAIALAIFGLLKVFRFTNRQAAVLACLIMIFFIFGGSLEGFLIQQRSFFFYLGKWIIFLSVCVLLLGSMLIYYKKRNPPAKTFSLYLVYLLSIAIIYEGVKFGRVLYLKKTLFSVITKMTTPVLENRKIEVTEKPDIHYIIFDSYTNAPTMDTIWNYANPVYKYLSDQGFYTIDSANSNYNFTPFSLGSILNLQYLAKGDQFLKRTYSNFYIGLSVFKNNQLFRFLKAQQYQVSVFSILEDKEGMESLGNFPPQTPVTWLRNQTLEKFYLDPWIAHKFLQIFVRKKGMPGPVLRRLQYIANYNKRALDHIRSVCDQTKVPGSPPTFSFTHFIIPHFPFIFDENGKVTLTLSNYETWMQRYLQQVKYANSIIKDITNGLLKDSTRKKIIILQGDHGYRDFPKSYQKDEYGAFSALYFYNKDYSSLNKSLSHVNTYRIVMNKFFNDTLPLLKDSIVLWNPNSSTMRE